MAMIVVWLSWLAICAGIVLVLIFILSKVGVAKRKVVFFSFTLFGVISGLVGNLNILVESALLANPGVLLGEDVYAFAIKRIGDPHSAFAHYTIPWILRIPQVFLLTSTIAWGTMGAIAQVIYNRRKGPAVMKGLSTRSTIILLLCCLAVSTGVVYALEDAHAEPLPVAFPVVEVGGLPIPDWETITTYEVESLYLADTVLVGRELLVTVTVMNTGMERGTARIGLSLDGKIVSSQEVALLPGESKPVRFIVAVPEEGPYVVGVDGLTANFEARGT